MADLNRTQNPNASTDTATAGDWATEESWWRDNWSSRPYARADRGFDYYGPAYRYGFESASRYRGKGWNEVENDLRTGWDKYEHRGKSMWADVKDAVRDMWEHVTGKDHEAHVRTSRR